MILVNGARQCGKSILVQLVDAAHAAEWRTLDRASLVAPPKRTRPASSDFPGLRRLVERLGDYFAVGIVLYTGDQTLPFGPRLRAMPVSALWEASP